MLRRSLLVVTLGLSSIVETACGAPEPLDCEAYVRCADDGGQTNRCEGHGDCTVVPGCATPICVDFDEACEAVCVDSTCALLESYPGQIACEGDVNNAVDDVACDEVRTELALIQSCTADDQCGQVIEGLACGCTRALVARRDAPVDIALALWEASEGCGIGSTCDCPEADGFACVEGACGWRYVGE